MLFAPHQWQVSGKGIKKYQQKEISAAFCVVSTCSEPVLLQVVPDVFTAAKWLGIDLIKFGVFSHLGVIVDELSLLLVPSVLWCLSLSQVAEGVYMMFKGRGASSRLSQQSRWCAVQKYFHWRRWFTQVCIGLWLWKRSISPLQPVHRFREEG